MKNVLSREPAILTRVPNKGVVKFQHEHFNVENTYFYNTLRLNQWMMLSHIMITLSECCYRNNEKKNTLLSNFDIITTTRHHFDIGLWYRNNDEAPRWYRTLISKQRQPTETMLSRVSWQRRGIKLISYFDIETTTRHHFDIELWYRNNDEAPLWYRNNDDPQKQCYLGFRGNDEALSWYRTLVS